MPASAARDVIALLVAWTDGDYAAFDELMPLVYAELRRLAHHYMRGERQGHTLQTTALVHEAYVRLVDCSRVRWENRAHFFAVSAQLMRRILVDAARTRGALKRGCDVPHVSLDEESAVTTGRESSLVALDEALTSLSRVDARKARVVELRYFGGLSVTETAEVLHVSPETVMRDWRLAKVWLLRELEEGPCPSTGSAR
ncbi:MAG: sigma-70 family RNA polymerase sigma factor [Acidobacteria bacterium]|nr:sigma-70 family RNA polymerase sigma factor [Acidobacteriota bacterium]